MNIAPCGSESPEGMPGVSSAVLHDRRRPGRRAVAPELIPVLRGQGPLLADAVPGSAEPPPVLALRDELGAMSGIMRGLGIVSVGWVAMAVLALR